MLRIIFKTTTICIISSLFFYTIAENCDSIPGINGKTSASRKFEIYGGEACETYMKIQWEDDYSNGNQHELRYGTTISYGSSVNLKPFQRRTPITTTVQNLTPETKYYAQFFRRYGNANKHVEFTFTTQKAENCDSIPNINGMTSASKRFEIKGGEACETYAMVMWQDNYSNGNEHELQYGTTTSYGEKINLKPFQRRTDITTRIPDLTPNTKYYAQFYRRYGDAIKNVKFSFTTSAQTGIIANNGLLKKHKSILYVRNNKLYVIGSVQSSDKINILNILGRNVSLLNISEKANSLPIPRLSAGLYVFQHLRNGTVVGSNKIIISSK